tara:strand:+ start:50 stop:154 length:105 start_codon:yes stop_codon:yes gene_type:complete
VKRSIPFSLSDSGKKVDEEDKGVSDKTSKNSVGN